MRPEEGRAGGSQVTEGLPAAGVGHIGVKATVHTQCDHKVVLYRGARAQGGCFRGGRCGDGGDHIGQVGQQRKPAPLT
jgi:hypothetical protein